MGPEFDFFFRDAPFPDGADEAVRRGQDPGGALVDIIHHFLYGAQEEPVMDARNDLHVFGPQIRHIQDVGDFALPGVPGAHQRLGHGRHLVGEHGVGVDGRFPDPFSSGGDEGKVIPDQVHGACFSGLDGKADDFHAVPFFPGFFRFAVAFVILALGVIGDAGQHGHLIPAFYPFRRDIVDAEGFGMEVLRYDQDMLHFPSVLSIDSFRPTTRYSKPYALIS